MAKIRGYRPDGRSKANKHFVGMPDAVWDHPKFRALSTNAKVVVMAITRRNFKWNNGQIVFSARCGEEIGLGRDATSRALREAEAAGFIEAKRRGAFTSKRLATVWAVTWQPVGNEAPTHAYRNSEPKIKASPSTRTEWSGQTDTNAGRERLQSGTAD